MEKEEFLLVCDVARETLRHWNGDSDQSAICLVRIRMNYAAALMRIGCTNEARQQLEPWVSDDFQPSLDRKLKAEIFLQLGEVLDEESHHATSRAEMLQKAGDALGYYQRSLRHDPHRLEALARTAAALLILGEPGSGMRQQACETARRILDIARGLENADGVNFETAWHGRPPTPFSGMSRPRRTYGQLQSIKGVATKNLADAAITLVFWLRHWASRGISSSRPFRRCS